MFRSPSRVFDRLLPLLLTIVLFAVGCVSSPAPAPTTPTATPSPTATAAPLAARPLVSIVDVAERVRPAVAFILAESTARDFFQRSVSQTTAGSGILFDDKGDILTNNHVVAGAQRLRVTLPDGRDFDATVVGRDSATDLAVIKIEGANLPTAVLGDSDTLRVGDWVVAIGNALALPGGPTVTVGVVSAVGRTIEEPNGNRLNDLIQTDAAINPGNSGGPLINMAGEVVGLNTVIAGGAQGIGFAVSIRTAKPVIEQLLAYGRVRWPWLGVGVEPVTPGLAAQENLSVKEGCIARTVERSGPAEAAGLKVGDIIVAVDGEKTATVRALQDTVRRHQIGDAVTVTYVRGTRTQTAKVTLVEMPRGS